MQGEELKAWRKQERKRLIEARLAVDAEMRNRWRGHVDLTLERHFPDLARETLAAGATAADFPMSLLGSWPGIGDGQWCVALVWLSCRRSGWQGGSRPATATGLIERVWSAARPWSGDIL